MKLGTVCAIVEPKGFGFIASPGTADIFFHMSELQGLEFDELLIERRVQFDLYDTERGPKARNVQAVEN